MAHEHSARRPRRHLPRREVAATAAAVRDLLRTKVLLGSYDERPLPDESALQRLHDASRGAIRAALALLRDEGLIERFQGSGTFVASQKTNHQFDELRALDTSGDGEQMTRDVLGCQVLAASDIVAELLDLAPGSEAVRLDRRTVAAGEVVGIWTTYLPMRFGAPLVTGAVDLNGDYYEVLERLAGEPIDHATLSTEAVTADGVVAAAMRIDVGAPLLRLERVVYLPGGRPLDFGIGRLRGDRVRLSSRLRRPGSDTH
jgi:GntR family transcriptional regulator